MRYSGKSVKFIHGHTICNIRTQIIAAATCIEYNAFCCCWKIEVCLFRESVICCFILWLTAIACCLYGAVHKSKANAHENRNTTTSSMASRATTTTTAHNSERPETEQ